MSLDTNITISLIDLLAGGLWSTATALLAYDSLDDKLSMLGVWALLTGLAAGAVTVLAAIQRRDRAIQAAFRLGTHTQRRGSDDAPLIPFPQDH